MPTPDLTGISSWLSANWPSLVLMSILTYLAYRGARPFIHTVLVRVVHAQAATIEDLLNKALRLAIVAGMATLILGLFDLWPLLAGFGLVLAALTFAGQSIILTSSWAS